MNSMIRNLNSILSNSITKNVRLLTK